MNQEYTPGPASTIAAFEKSAHVRLAGVNEKSRQPAGSVWNSSSHSNQQSSAVKASSVFIILVGNPVWPNEGLLFAPASRTQPGGILSKLVVAVTVVAVPVVVVTVVPVIVVPVIVVPVIVVAVVAVAVVAVIVVAVTVVTVVAVVVVAVDVDLMQQSTRKVSGTELSQSVPASAFNHWSQLVSPVSLPSESYTICRGKQKHWLTSPFKQTWQLC